MMVKSGHLEQYPEFPLGLESTFSWGPHPVCLSWWSSVSAHIVEREKVGEEFKAAGIVFEGQKSGIRSVELYKARLVQIVELTMIYRSSDRQRESNIHSSPNLSECHDKR
jgi:hypothetical protein